MKQAIHEFGIGKLCGTDAKVKLLKPITRLCSSPDLAIDYSYAGKENFSVFRSDGSLVEMAEAGDIFIFQDYGDYTVSDPRLRVEVLPGMIGYKMSAKGFDSLFMPKPYIMDFIKGQYDLAKEALSRMSSLIANPGELHMKKSAEDILSRAAGFDVNSYDRYPLYDLGKLEEKAVDFEELFTS